MSTDITTRQPTPSSTAIEQVLIKGDLSGLNEAQRLTHYRNVCESLGLNPLTTPFDYLKLNGKTVLYAKRDAAEQLRKIHGVSITDIQTQHFEGVYIVTAKAVDKTGRSDASTGVVPLGNLKGEMLANALMKAETKAKRRVTLSICGLGMLDETEVDSIPGAKPSGYTVTAQVPVITAPEPVLKDVLVAENEHVKAGDPVYADVAREHDDEITKGMVRIREVQVRDTANKNVKRHVIILSDGREVSTINQWLASLAEQVCQNGDAVFAETKESKWGEELVSLHREEPKAAPAPDIEPIDVSDIAF